MTRGMTISYFTIWDVVLIKTLSLMSFVCDDRKMTSRCKSTPGRKLAVVIRPQFASLFFYKLAP